MARPSRCRKICMEPRHRLFVPGETITQDKIILTVDEFEAIRLIDYEKKTHEQCAKQMEISRTTVTEIYEKARNKIADSIVNGKSLHISGGNYKICDGLYCRRCNKNIEKNDAKASKNFGKRKEIKIMRIAVAYENGNVFQHFGHTEKFKIYDIENDKIINSYIIDSNGSGHGALADMLSEAKVNALICGGIGAGAKNALEMEEIKIFGGVSGSSDEAVNALIAGALEYNPNVSCGRHGHHGENHNCGENKHGCSGR